ncbi:YceI family protein [Haloflavibacter putidus]|uniref:YceI family protein n=1 Tax=Haloflavibacter putidus TaxID=2576776 RepID=A0A507ZQE7_9FLAO|nr:YceI family protein [Haloflavibacter putidus]TQD39800.1 YceI family protein [Haloflavibacter putidus]
MRNLLITVLFLVGISQINAQTFIADAANSKLSVTGTSTLHDWECVAETFTGKVEATIENSNIKSINNFHFKLKAKSLKSGKSGMDKKMYDALEEEDYPVISFKGNQVKIDGNQAVFIGEMSIAGNSRSISAPVKINYTNNKIHLVGKVGFELTSFNIDPPKAMFGTITTGNEVVIHYEINLKN